MDIPHLVRERLDDEEVVATVSLGDEDVVCVTPTRTLVYRGEGLLSDESVSSFPHDVERFDVSEGRRKTKFVFEYVDGTESFSVPGSRAETLLSVLLQGILRVAGVTDGEESVAGVFRFSELTLIVTESRLVKHVGAPVWDDDYEAFDYDDVTGLEFEEGNVATQVVLTVEGRPQRIKAPTDEGPQLKQTLTGMLCNHYGVDSLAALEELLAESAPDADVDESDRARDIELDDGISPLVGESAETADAVEEARTETEREPARTEAGEPAGETAVESVGADPLTERPGADAGSGAESDAGPEGSREEGPTGAAEGVDPEAIEAIREQLSTLTTAVRRQNELLRRHDERIETNTETIASHDETIEKLIEELRRGR